MDDLELYAQLAGPDALIRTVQSIALTLVQLEHVAGILAGSAAAPILDATAEPSRVSVSTLGAPAGPGDGPGGTSASEYADLLSAAQGLVARQSIAGAIAYCTATIRAAAAAGLRVTGPPDPL